MKLMIWIVIYRLLLLLSRMRKIQMMIQPAYLERKYRLLCTSFFSQTDSRYVRELMKYLRADDYNKVHIGLKTAPNLIRQKATFGTELSDQAQDLARILVGLQDTYEMEKFQEMRQSALIALVASAPEIVAAYLIDVYFTGDISMQQRLIILSAMGIGARELAALEKTVALSFTRLMLRS